MELDFRPVDADNHYYEPLDAFTRYQDPAMRRRGVQVLRDGKRAYVLVADKVNRFIPNPTFDPVIVPGCTGLLFRGQVPRRGGSPLAPAGGADPRGVPRPGQAPR